MEVQLPTFFIYFSLMLIGIKLECGQSITTMHRSNETDLHALLAFKDQITADPLQFLTSWNNSAHFCSWPGITCSRRHGRVTRLQLPNLGLKGLLSPHLGNLSFLRSLDVRTNGFHGTIPTELARLFRLNVLAMTNNSLEGKIPASLSNCSRLVYLYLGGNRLVGNVPAELGSLSQLVYLRLYANKLTGTISPSLANLSTLMLMSLAYNSIEGNIPSELGRLFSLRELYIGENKLSGMIPHSLYNLSSLTMLALTENRLWGTLPSNIGLTIPNLVGFYVAGNKFTGSLPATLANASHLTVLEFANNHFTGPVPADLGKLQNLSFFHIWGNSLGGVGKDDLQFITALSNCTRLIELEASYNSLMGSLPNSIANLSEHLTIILLGENQIHGTIPSGIDKLVKLQWLSLQQNFLTGEIPNTIGMIPGLVKLYLSKNKFTGEIPGNIGNLTQLIELLVDGNLLKGNIPSTIGKSGGDLLILSLSNNKLSGNIPITLFNLSSLVTLTMDNNLLTGPVPPEVGKLIHLSILDVDSNNLTGEIPPTIGGCSTLQYLYMQNNSLSGTIPPSLAYVEGIKQLNFSYNNLSGNIPEFLSKLSQMYSLDLSFNNFKEEVPRGGVFSNISAIRVKGNPKLCGGISELHLAPCPPKVTNQGRKSRSRKVTLSIVGPIVGAMIICCLAVIYGRKKHRKHHSSTSSRFHQHLTVSYAELFKATDNFSSSTLIGRGSFGSVYRGVLEHYQVAVAIKVFNLDQVHAVRTFMAECEALRNIRHRNLVKILTSCSSLDFKGNEFKALVFELMSNGSIEQWLHQEMNGNDSSKYLNFSTRLDLAIDVATALDYLHNECVPPIVHCDIKPSNILLDDDMAAHLGDFGLAKSILTSDASSTHQTSASIMKGSIGYIAPEYGTQNAVTTHGDVYSYGIVLLEMITRKKPTSEMFCEGLDLKKYVKMAIPERLVEILDPQLLQQEDPKNMEKVIESLVVVARIGLACSVEYPKERMDVKDICKELIKVRRVFRET